MQSKAVNRLLVVLILLLGLTAQSTQATSLHIAFHEFPPFSFNDEQGKPSGALVEIAQRICQDWPDKCEISLQPFRRAKQMFSNGKIQATFLGWNQERTQTMWFSLPIIETEYGFYTLTSQALPQNKITQTPLTVGVFSPSNTHESLLRIDAQQQRLGAAKMRIELYPQANDLPMRMLQKQRFDAYYVNKDVGDYYVKSLGLTDLRYTQGENHILYCLAFDMDHNNFDSVKSFNHLLISLFKAGELDAIYEKWQLTRPKDVNHIDYAKFNMPF